MGEVPAEVSPGDTRGPGVEIEELAHTAGEAVYGAPSGASTARRLAGARGAAQRNAASEAGVGVTSGAAVAEAPMRQSAMCGGTMTGPPGAQQGLGMLAPSKRQHPGFSWYLPTRPKMNLTVVCWWYRQYSTVLYCTAVYTTVAFTRVTLKY